MSVTAQDVANVAEGIAAVAAVWDPKKAGALVLLIRAISQGNELVKKIQAQTEANAAQVWTEVETDFNQSVLAFQNSIAKSGEQPHA